MVKKEKLFLELKKMLQLLSIIFLTGYDWNPKLISMKGEMRLTFIISCNYSLDCIKMNGKNMNISKIFDLQFNNQQKFWLSENLSQNYDLICHLKDFLPNECIS